jgi:hypothetical protein
MIGPEQPSRQAQEEARPKPQPGLFALLAEFDNVDDLLVAADGVRKSGYTHWDVHTPFPVHGMDDVMQLPKTRLPWIVFVMGIAGALGGLVLVWWTNATSLPVPYALRGYQYVIAGKPIFSLPANIPVIFETTVLLAALGAVFGMFVLNRLPLLFNPLFKSERFRRVSDNKFFICIEARDPRFDRSRTADMLLGLKAAAVEEVEA